MDSHLSNRRYNRHFYRCFLAAKNLAVGLKEDSPGKRLRRIFCLSIPSLSFDIPDALVLDRAGVLSLCEKPFSFGMDSAPRDGRHLCDGMDGWISERDHPRGIGNPGGHVKPSVVGISPRDNRHPNRFAVTTLEFDSRDGFGRRGHFPAMVSCQQESFSK